MALYKLARSADGAITEFPSWEDFLAYAETEGLQPDDQVYSPKLERWVKVKTRKELGKFFAASDSPAPAPSAPSAELSCSASVFTSTVTVEKAVIAKTNTGNENNAGKILHLIEIVLFIILAWRSYEYYRCVKGCACDPGPNPFAAYGGRNDFGKSLCRAMERDCKEACKRNALRAPF